MIKFPRDKWSQPNESDKIGNLSYTKNMSFDERSYIKLSPRTVKLTGDDVDANFDIPVGIEYIGNDAYKIGTTDSAFSVTLGEEQRTFTEDTGTANPSMTFDSDTEWFQGILHASTDTTVVSRPATGGATQTWTSRITGLTSGKQHKLTTFSSRVSLTVTNGNVLKQYDTSYANTTDLTIPSDFEIVGTEYNNGYMGVITRLTNDGTVGQDQEARFFLWDGSTTAANRDAGLGSDAGVGIAKYKSSFVVFTRSGELLFWNGGGFTRLAAMPLYYMEKAWGGVQTNSVLGDVRMTVDGDKIYINFFSDLNSFGERAERFMPQMPSGVWCYDPNVGLYHKYTPSISQAYVNYVSQANVNTSTDVMTASAGNFGLQTIPPTGNIARLMSTDGIGGLVLNKDYYIINTGSNTFKLATTRENALNGVAIDLTSASGSDNYFWMYDEIDYGTSYHTAVGDVRAVTEPKQFYSDVIFGGRYDTTALATNDAICTAVPRLPNIGYFVTAKYFPDSNVKEAFPRLFLKFRPLGANDKITVRTKTKDIYGVPTSSTGTTGATWSGKNQLYVTADFSEAKTYLDASADNELTMEIIAGTGAGNIVKVTAIDTDDNLTYSFTLEEDVWGVTAGDKCHFFVDNWKKAGETITSSSECAEDGYVEISPEEHGKWVLFQVELRGDNTTIEEMQIINRPHEQAK